MKSRTQKQRSVWWGLLASLAFFTSPSLAQEEIVPIPSAPNGNAATEEQSTEGLYFADVLVRGRPLFQIGSLSQVSARDRAAIINRRIRSLVSQNANPEPVVVSQEVPGEIATLRVNNRVIMTVTQQDAEDFGLTVEALAERWAQQLTEAFDKPPLAVDVGQRLYGTTRDLVRDAIANLPSLIGAILVVLFTWMAARLVRFLAFTWAQQTEGDSSTELLVGRLSYGGVWVLGSVIALGVFGLDFAALLGALGLTSVAIGFSLKDVLSNYISGVILLAARPFRIGDPVTIEEYEGTVAQVQLRATTITTYDGRVVYIPNQEVFQANIVNNTASPRRRSSVLVGIDYEEDIDRVKAIVLRAIANLSEVEADPPPYILVNELAASTVNLEICFWVDSRRAGYLTTTSAVAQVTKEALSAERVEMPTDIYTLVFRNGPAAETNGETPSPSQGWH